MVPPELYAHLSETILPPEDPRCCTDLVKVIQSSYWQCIGRGGEYGVYYHKYEAWYDGEIECSTSGSSSQDVISQGYGRLIERDDYE